METTSERPDLSFARVLVVDDMQSILVMMSGLIKKYKIQVDCVSGGEEAIARMKKGDPVYNAIFMDQFMPGMDGMETIRWIRAIGTDYARNIPVIAMTGDETSQNEELFITSGFQAFVAKPFSISKLDPVLRKWIHP